MRVILLLVLCILSQLLPAAGLLMPVDKSWPPLHLSRQGVDVHIDNGVATVVLEQTFVNHTDRALEATYVLPVPAGAAVDGFALKINDQPMAGEVLERGKARRLYEDIVRRARDPGLLEYLEDELLQLNVFPIPARGTQQVAIRYTTQLPFSGGIYRFTCPLRTAKQHRVAGTDVALAVRAVIKTVVPLKAIYSPSHELQVVRDGELQAELTTAANDAALDRDLELFFTVSDRPFGLHVTTRRSDDQPGYFMMLLAPELKLTEADIVARDVVFVCDTSGSMVGDKIDQARSALKYCLQKLRPVDRFGIVRFSTEGETQAPALCPADQPHRAAALAFIDQFAARGGTNIDEALQLAVGLRQDPSRPFTIIFLTDGKPTMGTTDSEKILARLPADSAVRVFVFGVGEGVNTQLLDRLAGEHGGVCSYVRPQQDIEVEVSAFYDKISLPVLTSPQLEFGGLAVSAVYPKQLPDLFHGGQLTVIGRYTGQGDFAVQLKGDVNGQQQQFVYEHTFPARHEASSFLPRLWAMRRIGHLLDQIRLHGEDRELTDEIIRLSQLHGVMTPYTSWLVVEDEQQLGQVRPAGASPQPAGARFKRLAAAASRAASADEAAAEVTGALRRQVSGELALDVSEEIGAYKVSRVIGRPATAQRLIGDRSLAHENGVWIDADAAGKTPTRTIAYGSAEYFALLAARPELKPVFMLGVNLVLAIDGDIVAVK